MKVRNGFVSNSSSSNFVLFGIKIVPEKLLDNPEFKVQFDDRVVVEQSELNTLWYNKLNHVDFAKHKEIYEMCKTNNVSIPTETEKFFGYNFKGIFEPSKLDERNKKSILMEMIWDGTFKFPKKIETLSDDSVTYLGKVLTDGEELDNGNLSLTQIKKYTEEFIKLGFEESDIKIYYGTRAC